jgi:hypothetical protein
MKKFCSWLNLDNMHVHILFMKFMIHDNTPKAYNHNPNLTNVWKCDVYLKTVTAVVNWNWDGKLKLRLNIKNNISYLHEIHSLPHYLKS